MSEKLFLKVVGDGFALTFQAEGDLEAAKAALSEAFNGLPVEGYEVGDVDMSGR